EPAQGLADRSASDGEDAAEVRLDQNSQGVASQVRRQPATGGADPALETEGHRPATRTDAALLDRAHARFPDGSQHVCFGDRSLPDITEHSVIGFCDQRVDRTYVLVAR